MTDIRELLDDLGDIDIEVEEGDIITDVVVLVRVQRFDDTDDTLLIGTTANTGGIVCSGILHSASLQHDHWMINGLPGDCE